jgi:hypothetical protein
MPHAAEYETAETLGANRGDIPATGTRDYASSGGAGGALRLSMSTHPFLAVRSR